MTVRDRLVVVIVVALVAVVGAWILVIGPKRDQANKLASQVAAAQTQFDVARAQIAAAELDRNAYARNYQAVAELGKAVPPDAETPSLIFQLQNAATGSRVDFLSVALNGATVSPAGATPTSTSPASTATAPGSTIAAQPITISFQGNFFHLASFLGRIERFVVASTKTILVSGRLMTLNGITFGAAASGFPQITATITASTYLLPATAGLATSPPSAVPAGSSSAGTVSGSASPPSPAAAITP